VSLKPKHALLRDGTHWEGISTMQLQQTDTGDLSLLRLPAVAGEAIDLRAPWEQGVSGLAISDKGLVCISDTQANQVVCIDHLCDARTHITGYGFKQPRGLLITNNCLYVADSGNARIQVFHLKKLELHDVWHGSFTQPVDLAVDRDGRIYVLDVGLKTALRFSANGVIDNVYNDAMTAHVQLVEPVFLAIDARDILYVSDQSSNRILRFDAAGILSVYWQS
jgi:sugar lactone lactonase YvrE